MKQLFVKNSWAIYGHSCSISLRKRRAVTCSISLCKRRAVTCSISSRKRRTVTCSISLRKRQTDYVLKIKHELP